MSVQTEEIQIMASFDENSDAFSESSVNPRNKKVHRGKNRIDVGKDENGFEGIIINRIDENQTKSISDKMTKQHMEDYYKALK